jgi:two-component system, NarL family, sensor histidine kinase UhpB
VELVIYRIAQEAVTNALRHAGAAHIHVTLHCPGEEIELRIRDDGRGLPEELPDDTAGLSGMRERAHLVAGRLRLRSTPGRGTDVRLAIPLHEATA